MSLRVLATASVLAALAAVPTIASADAPPGASPEAAALYEDYPVVELVTMGVGALIWERHGHIALCIRYANRRRDACYNYGIGDFANPLSMGWGFFRGTDSFWVGKKHRNSMLDLYRRADRTIWVQPLPLTVEQKQAVIAKLEHDILPENRAYSYDHFWDNCTTRVRDVIDDATGGALSSMDGKVDKTYRELAREGFYGMRVPLLITDIAMGRVTDRKPSYYERMFLPDYMREAVVELWSIEPIEVYSRVGAPPEDSGPSGRVIFALIIVLLTAPAWATRLWGRFERAGMWIAVIPPVFFGVILWALAIVSPLPYVRYNESLLVFLPADVLLVAFLSADRRRLYARGRVIMLGAAVLLMLAGVLTQPLVAPLLWPLIPAAVIGFWPTGDTHGARTATTEVVAAGTAGSSSP